MQDMTVRPARAHDLAAIEEFQQRIIEAERPFDPTLGRGAIRYYDTAQLLAADNVRLAVAELDGALVGCGFVRIEAAKPYLAHRLHGYLGLMYVDPSVRGRSINAAIVDHLKEWCRTRKVLELRLEVYHGNLAARRAYEKSGFTPLLVEMRCSI
jgi:GNAT superfamily N-acetyltransferase